MCLHSPFWSPINIWLPMPICLTSIPTSWSPPSVSTTKLHPSSQTLSLTFIFPSLSLFTEKREFSALHCHHPSTDLPFSMLFPFDFSNDEVLLLPCSSFSFELLILCFASSSDTVLLYLCSLAPGSRTHLSLEMQYSPLIIGFIYPSNCGLEADIPPVLMHHQKVNSRPTLCLCHSPHFLSLRRHFIILHHQKKGEYSIMRCFERELLLQYILIIILLLVIIANLLLCFI